jgi:flagellar protein FliO/FliZ
VIGIIYAVARILRAVKGRDAVRASGNGLEQIATLPLAPGKSVALLRAGRDIVLVGVGEHGVTPIKTYTEAEAIAAGIDLPEEPDADFDETERPFGRVLDGLRRRTVRP